MSKMITVTPDDLPGALGADMARVLCGACGVHFGEVKVFRYGKYGICEMCAICHSNYVYATKKD